MVLDEARALQGQLIEWRRYLHRFPEVELNTPETAKFVKQQLEAMGLEVRYPVGVNGVVGLLRGHKPGKTFAIRADIDGLRIREETGLQFASEKEGMFHGCGHDGHTAMALGAAKLLSNHCEDICGSVKFLFQPGEEGPGGAKPMIEDGAMDNPKVDAVIGTHLGGVWPNLKPGQIGISFKPMFACLDRIKIRVKGKGGHGAAPHETVDPISMAAHAYVTLQTIVSREVKPVQPAVITVGKFHGGTAYNIIPEEVDLEGTVRAFDQGLRESLARRIGEIFEGVTTGMRGTCEYEYTFGYPPTVNDPEFTREFQELAAEVVGADNVIELDEPTMGGEDMAYFLQQAPGTFFFLCSHNKEKGIVYPHHHPRFDIDEDVLWIGTALFSHTAVSWLKKHSG